MSRVTEEFWLRGRTAVAPQEEKHTDKTFTLTKHNVYEPISPGDSAGRYIISELQQPCCVKGYSLQYQTNESIAFKAGKMFSDCTKPQTQRLSRLHLSL